MATFNTVWSLDVGHFSLKAVRLRRERNNVEILAVDQVDYQIGPNGIDSATQAKEALSAFKVRNDVKDPVFVAHPGQGTLSRFIKVPAVDPKKVKEMVGHEASQQIPFPLDEVIWDYHIIQRQYLTGEEREAGIFAARREAIDDYLLDFTSEDLQVEGLSIGYLSLFNYVVHDLQPQEPSIVLDIGASHTDLLLVDGQKFWTRALPHSGNDINKAIMDRFKLSFAEAEKLKVESARNPKQAVKIFTAVIQPKLKDLVNEIHRSIGYYRSQHGEVQFKQLYLLGNGSKVLGIKKYLEEHLGVQATRVQTINTLRINREVNIKLLQANLPGFGTALGCALQGVGIGACKVDLIPQEERIEKEYARKKKHVWIGIAIVYLAILLGWWMVRSKVGAASAVIDDARTFLRAYDLPAGDLNDLKIEDSTQKQGMLLEVAKLRAKTLESIDLLGEVLTLHNLKDHVTLQTQIPADAAEKDRLIKEVRDQSEAKLAKKVWIPWMRIDRVEWPEPVQGAKDKPATVPAFKVTLFAVVTFQQNEQVSLDLLKSLIESPLEDRLRANKDLTKDPEVTVSSSFQRLERIEHQQQKGAGPAGFRRGQPQFTQEGGPFFGTEISWYMRSDDPKAPEVPEKKK